VKVQGVAMGNSIEEVLWDFPQLNSAQIHDALSYYHDHKQEMDVLLEQATYEYWESRIAKVNRDCAKAVS